MLNFAVVAKFKGITIDRILCKFASYFCFSLLIVSMLSIFSCSSKGSSEQISEDLADRLTDSLDFEGGTLEEGEPPKGDSNPLAPQIISIKAPDEFQLGAAFSTVITSDYETNNVVARLLANSKDDPVVKVIIRVIGSDKGYFIVPVEMLYNKVELAGILEGNEDLRDLKFKLEFALQTVSGMTGEYKPLDFIIKDAPPQLVANPMSSLDFGDGTDFKDSGRPDGSNDPFAPQILGIEAEEEIQKDSNFTVDLLTDFSPAEKIELAIMTYPLSSGYFELKGSMVETLSGSAYRIKGSMVSSEINIGDSLTFLFALRSSDGKVGTYKGWSVLITDPNTDGDQEIMSDGDGLPEGIFVEPISTYSSSNTALDQSVRSKQSLGAFKRRLFIIE